IGACDAQAGSRLARTQAQNREGSSMRKSRSESDVSRRDVARWAAVAGSALAAPTAAQAQADRSDGIRGKSVLPAAPAPFFEVIEPAGSALRTPPMFLIHGGGH